MKHLINTSNGTSEKYSDSLWTDIEDMPIWNWNQICETGDLKYLYKDLKGRVSKTLDTLWTELQQQYIDEFGLDENFKQQLRLKKDLIKLNCDYILTKDRFKLVEIKIKQADILSLSGKRVVEFYEVLDHVEKYKGFEIDPKKTSVKKWYWTLKNMAKNGKTDSGK